MFFISRRLAFLLTIITVLLLALSVSAQDSTYYVSVASAKVRVEPSTKANIVTTLKRGTAVTYLESVEGTKVGRSTIWYHVQIGEKEGYIHSSLLTTRAPAAPVVTQVPGNTSVPAVIPTTASSAPPVSSVSCSGDVYNCSDLSCSQIAVYASTCSGDPSRLDSDHDGLYCESKC